MTSIISDNTVTHRYDRTSDAAAQPMASKICATANPYPHGPAVAFPRPAEGGGVVMGLLKSKTLTELINAASADLKLARDSACESECYSCESKITNAIRRLDELIDQLPRIKQPQP